jgi:hypothetical protein
MQFITITPVLPSANIGSDSWYKEMAGFTTTFFDDMYAVLQRDGGFLHLQWHANTNDDPLFGGFVIKIFVKNLRQIFNEFIEKGNC